jgi:hypothetical protein
MMVRRRSTDAHPQRCGCRGRHGPAAEGVRKAPADLFTCDDSRHPAYQNSAGCQ